MKLDMGEPLFRSMPYRSEAWDTICQYDVRITHFYFPHEFRLLEFPTIIFRTETFHFQEVISNEA